jgi:tetratricopeptide (TPR) repeat protein
MYWCDLALAGDAPLDSAAAARSLLGKAVVALHMLQTREIAEPMLLQAGRVASATGDRWTEAYASGYRSMCLTNSGDFDAAVTCADVTARIAEELHDPVLRGLAGLARGWILLARGSFHDAIRELTAVEDLGPDLHQHHFIKVYIGLVHFELGEWQPAAQRLLDGLRTAAGYRNVRGMAGSVEGCGYIAVELGLHAQAVEMLGAAGAMRNRTALPLFNFWVRHNQHAHAAARRALGSKAYAERLAFGEQMRDEDSIGRAASMLRAIAAGESTPPPA